MLLKITVLLCIIGYTACQDKSSKALKPITPVPWRKCCPYARKVMTLDLHSGSLVNGYVLPGLTKPVIRKNFRFMRKKCSHMADFKATFHRLPRCWRDWNQCMNKPICGNRMLKIELELHSQRQSYLYNVGDSQSNNGWGGDFRHQKNDAEIMGFSEHHYEYLSEYCNTNKTQFPFLLQNANTVTIWVGNEFSRIQMKNSAGVVIADIQRCNRCLFALNWQPDQCPTCRNMDIYIALNNMIHGVYRSGYGVCKANISWECCQN